MERGKEREVLEVEVERLPEAGERSRRRAAPPGGGSGQPASASARPLHPLAGGVLIDLLDVATLGMTGIYVGLPLGLAAGFYLGRRMGLDRRRSLGLGLACGIYCWAPFTSPIPLGTLIGAYRALHSGGTSHS